MKIKVELEITVDITQEVEIEAVSLEDLNQQLEDVKQKFLDDNYPTVKSWIKKEVYESLPEKTPMEKWKLPKNNLELPLNIGVNVVSDSQHIAFNIDKVVDCSTK